MKSREEGGEARRRAEDLQRAYEESDDETLTWIMDNGEKAPSHEETVLVTKVKSRGQTAPRQQAHAEKIVLCNT